MAWRIGGGEFANVARPTCAARVVIPLIEAQQNTRCMSAAGPFGERWRWTQASCAAEAAPQSLTPSNSAKVWSSVRVGAQDVGADKLKCPPSTLQPVPRKRRPR